MRDLRQRMFLVASACSLLVSLVGGPIVAFGGTCSVQATANTLGSDVSIHAVASCTAGVRAIRYFVGDSQIGETAGADGTATYHPTDSAGNLTIRVAAAEVGDNNWSHPVQTSMNLQLGSSPTADRSQVESPAQAQAPGQPQTSQPASPLTQLSSDQRDLYQRAIAALRHDPDYDGLGHSAADWTNLVARNDCMVNAMQIRTPDPSAGEIGRPQLEMIAQIDDLSGRAKGTLIRDLSEQKELNGQLKSLADNLQTFVGVVQDFTWMGLFKAIGSIGYSELVAKPIAAQFQAHHFNRLYFGDSSFVGFQQQADKWGPSDAVAHMVEEGALVEGGSLWDDWKAARIFFEGLNDKAQLGWDNDTINNQVGQYLQQRYLTDTGGLASWLAPVTKPEDGMENTLRDAMHTMKLQLKQYLMNNISDSCWQAPSDAQSDTTSAQPPVSAAVVPPSYFVYVLGTNGGIGFYVGTDADVSKTASCRFAGGGLCGNADPPVTVFKKVLGPFDSPAAAHAALKQTLVCQSGYWGPQGQADGKWYWLQNNVTTADCKSLKNL